MKKKLFYNSNQVPLKSNLFQIIYAYHSIYKSSFVSVSQWLTRIMMVVYSTLFLIWTKTAWRAREDKIKADPNFYDFITNTTNGERFHGISWRFCWVGDCENDRINFERIERSYFCIKNDNKFLWYGFVKSSTTVENPAKQ